MSCSGTNEPLRGPFGSLGAGRVSHYSVCYGGSGAGGKEVV